MHNALCVKILIRILMISIGVTHNRYWLIARVRLEHKLLHELQCENFFIQIYSLLQIYII